MTVDGRGPVKFDAGLMPVKLGDPQERVIPLNVALPGDGPKIAIQNLARARNSRIPRSGPPMSLRSRNRCRRR